MRILRNLLYEFADKRRGRIVNLLSASTGMQLGEILALKTSAYCSLLLPKTPNSYA